jgi:hypothetical protein
MKCHFCNKMSSTQCNICEVFCCEEHSAIDPMGQKYLCTAHFAEQTRKLESYRCDKCGEYRPGRTFKCVPPKGCGRNICTECTYSKCVFVWGKRRTEVAGYEGKCPFCGATVTYASRWPGSEPRGTPVESSHPR